MSSTKMCIVQKGSVDKSNCKTQAQTTAWVWLGFLLPQLNYTGWTPEVSEAQQKQAIKLSSLLTLQSKGDRMYL